MRVLILGAGPAGLGAAHRLHELGHDDWLLLEASDGPGGLASSVADDKGFTWDHGVHVLHSHYAEFDRVMDSIVGVPVDGKPFEWLEARRSAWAWIDGGYGGRFVGYPVQENFWALDDVDVARCLEGLYSRDARLLTLTFEEWIYASFGAGLADIFMLPYNRKVWGCEPAEMNKTWVGDRVSQIDMLKIIGNRHKTGDSGWGPNATFRYPARGGTGAIWKAVASGLPKEKIQYGYRADTWSLKHKSVHATNAQETSGDAFFYDVVISTLPLDRLSDLFVDGVDYIPSAPRLRYQTTHVVGLGFKGCPTADLSGKSWIYFPGGEPFYRMTVLSRFSENMAPVGHWSVLFEVGDREARARAGAVQGSIDAFKALGWTNGSELVSTHYRRLERGYPVPTLDRDEILGEVQPRLKEMGIVSVGRFGGWKYEESNQDHSWMAGVKAVDQILEKS